MSCLFSAAVAGLSAGGAYAILGVCAIFTYKLVAVVNFTGAAIGAIGTFIMVALFGAGVPLVFAVLLGIAAGALAGILVGLVMTTWFANANASTKAAVTAALLVGIIAVGLRLTGGQHPHYFPEVISGSAFRLAGVEVTWAAVLTLVLSVAFTILTEQFLARTRTGLQLRALSQRPMAAELIGIRVRLLALGVWAVTGAVTAFALMVIAPLRSPDFASLSLLVVPALAAALIGAFSSFRAALAGGVLIGGLAAVPVGIAIGLPALRLREINLAIVTLSFAAAFDTVLATITFPGQTSFTQVARPDLFASDRGYFLFVLLAYGIIAVVLEFISHSRLGASWLAVRHSERAAAANGISIPRAKLSAFAISAFISGISGGLLAGYLGTLVAENFSMMQSLALFAVATMAGAHFTLDALIGGVLIVLFPELLRRLNLPQDIGNVFFALGAVQALSSGETIAESWTRLAGKLFPQRAKQARPTAQALANSAPAIGEGTVLEVRDLTVRYGAVTALNKVNITVPAGTVVGLVGPNGTGKSTLVDAIAGFLPRYDGTVLLHEKPLEALSATARAKAGIRRTWQTTRIAPELRIGDYIRLAASPIGQTELESLLGWFGCPPPETPIASIDAGTRRLLDVAGAVASRAPVILLDEPAAGISYDEALKLGERIAAIPATFGSAVLLIEHDMDLVQRACTAITVFDFGQVIASGEPAEVLDMPEVQKAYMGVDFEEAAE
ncbi:branched-chain amino acid ABC transporter ATP-binding protein [Brucella vulpis]|uniref:ABC transporter permease subunit n=1 Tax=Brucella vulpis TaxID=981386 RepID=UPI00073A67DF|nr:branched-chain amino acid ABC transporter permease [Brucella vulpis]CUW51832.1 branched-chain amino acid ABC transporter ATP-binding protein [Brucella vulpis]